MFSVLYMSGGVRQLPKAASYYSFLSFNDSNHLLFDKPPGSQYAILKNHSEHHFLIGSVIHPIKDNFLTESINKTALNASRRIVLLRLTNE